MGDPGGATVLGVTLVDIRLSTNIYVAGLPFWEFNDDDGDDPEADNGDGQCNAPPSMAVIGCHWQDNVHTVSQPTV